MTSDNVPGEVEVTVAVDLSGFETNVDRAGLLLAAARRQAGVPYRVPDRPPEPAQHPVRPERAAWEDEEALTLARLATLTDLSDPYTAAKILFTEETT
ncbi:hypothetical protein ACQEU3_46980 [Spirillospora sp. CA-253888]